MPAAADPNFDALRYPRTAAYLAQLPDGLDSYPGCLAKTEIHRTVYSYANDALTGLPTPLQDRLDRRAPSRKWIPQCHTLALILAIVESRRLRPLDEGEWIRDAASSLFSTPMYKVLMWAASPRLLLRGADMRWAAFFRGSSLHPRVGEDEAELELLAPPRLFDERLALVFTDVLCAAITYTDDDSQRTQVEFVDWTPGRIRYRARW